MIIKLSKHAPAIIAIAVQLIPEKPPIVQKTNSGNSFASLTYLSKETNAENKYPTATPDRMSVLEEFFAILAIPYTSIMVKTELMKANTGSK